MSNERYKTDPIPSIIAKLQTYLDTADPSDRERLISMLDGVGILDEDKIGEVWENYLNAM